MYSSKPYIFVLALYGSLCFGCAKQDNSMSVAGGSADAPTAMPRDPNSEEVVIATPLAAPSSSPSDDDATGGTLFTTVPSEQSGVDFQMQLSDPRKHIREFTFLSPYGGICTGDFDGDGRPDFYVSSAHGSGRLFRNLGDFRFEDVTKATGIFDAEFWTTGASLVDVDNDGALDLYLCGYNQPNRCYINQGAKDGGLPTFIDRAKTLRLDYDGASMTMAFADIDNDGDLDGYLATTAKAPPPGTKFEVRFVGGRPIVPSHLREYWELIYLPGERAHRTEAGQYDHLYRNDGDRFTEITKQSGIDGAYFTLAATWWDYNQDGLPDVYVSNDYSGPDFLYHNNGNGTFTNVAPSVLPHSAWFSMGSDIADFNNDGLIDFFATDMSARTPYREKMMMGNFDASMPALDVIQPRQYMRNALYLNTGGRRMREASRLAGMASTDWTWNPRFADYDNDGDVDAFITNGILRDMMNADLSARVSQQFQGNSPEWVDFWASQPLYKESNVAFENKGDMRFEDVSDKWGLRRMGVTFGAASADFDGDGDLDLVVNNADVPVGLYRNNSQKGARIVVRLRGVESNRFGLGTTIRVRTGDKQQTQYVTTTRGWLSAVGPETHFGLGDAESIDEMTIHWPSGNVQTLRDLKTNMHYSIAERADADAGSRDNPLPLFAEQTDLSAVKFREIEHQERPYDDFLHQPLLPYKLSQFGPATAWGDVNGDGLADCYLGGSSGNGGQLLINNGVGKLELRRVAAFTSDRRSEDAAACLFDADGDDDLDLYVASGSVELNLGDEGYRDRLYLNDGAGAFTKAENALPDLRDSGGAVAASDFDHDGDIDLFVGSRCVPGNYPTPPTSRLLINNGGRFEELEDAPVSQVGMATDAVWEDVDGDDWADLLVTIDRGPVRLFVNQEGKLVERTSEAGLQNLLGWWQAIASGDLDRDGDVDFVVTNLGHNTRYQATAEQPEVVYYGAFDDSQRKYILEVMYDGSKQAPRRGLDSYKRVMPTLADSLDSFDAFARTSIDQWIAPAALNQALRLDSNTFATGVLYNDGGSFRFEPLPSAAQIAPSRGAAVADVNADGRLDIALAQNFYAVPPETGSMDGGVGVVLLGKQDGGFAALEPQESGVLVVGDMANVAAVDLNADDRPDLVFAVNNGPLRAYENAGPNGREGASPEDIK